MTGHVNRYLGELKYSPKSKLLRPRFKHSLGHDDEHGLAITAVAAIVVLMPVDIID